MADTQAKKPDFEIPDDFDDEAAFLEDMRNNYQRDCDADRENRDAGTEDAQFLVGDQWSAEVRQRRERARKPVLTVNRIPAFVAQIIGNRRMNETSFRVVADTAGSKAAATVREDLMRAIQKDSRADMAYDKALENQVTCGIGNFQLELDYESDDVFDQCIKISQIPDAFAVTWDRMSVDPTGEDAKRVFVEEAISKQDYESRWPWAAVSDVVPFEKISSVTGNGWFSESDVRIVAYWRMRTRKRFLALLRDGSTQDVTDLKNSLPEDEWDAGVEQNVVKRADGTPIMREVDRKYAEMYLCSGSDILEGPYELPISRVPVFRVPGWEVFVGEKRHRWGLVRFLKDPQRLHNYWRSVIAEKIMQSPRAVWKVAKEAISGYEKQWRNSHLSDDPLLVFNGDSGHVPERVDPVQLEPSLMTQAEITAQDLKDVSNIHEANLGMPSNEVSGRAIMARQRVSDTGIILYHDNLNMAIEQCGMVMNQLIPVVYDTPRVLRLLGQDGQQYMQVINDITNENSVNTQDGKYHVSIVTGPSYQTKRIEAAEAMMTFVNAMPQTASIAADLIVENQDWPGADKIAARLRMLLPPGMVDPNTLSPDELRNYMQMAQQNSDKAKMAYASAMAKLQSNQADAALKFAQARKTTVEAAAVPAKTMAQQTDVASQAADRELRGHLEAIRTAHGG